MLYKSKCIPQYLSFIWKEGCESLMHHSLHFQHFYPCICSWYISLFNSRHILYSHKYQLEIELNLVGFELHFVIRVCCCYCTRSWLSSNFHDSQYECMSTILTMITILYIQQQKIHKINNPFDLERVLSICVWF